MSETRHERTDRFTTDADPGTGEYRYHHVLEAIRVRTGAEPVVPDGDDTGPLPAVKQHSLVASIAHQRSRALPGSRSVVERRPSPSEMRQTIAQAVEHGDLVRASTDDGPTWLTLPRRAGAIATAYDRLVQLVEARSDVDDALRARVGAMWALRARLEADDE